MTNKPSIRLVQISDPHIYANKEKTLLGVNTYQSFSAVLDLIKTDSTPPDLILLTGDLAQDHSEAAYQLVKEAFESFNIPISQKPKAVEGYLEDTQFDFLENCLAMYPNHHAIIVFHHQPIPVGTSWLDKLGLINADKLWETLKRYPQVQTLLFGHVHQAHAGKKNGISYYATPSTCIQFKRNCVDFALEELPPGYRWLDLYPNGDMKTDIRRLANYIGVFDIDAKGY